MLALRGPAWHVESLRVPAFTAYLAPDPGLAHISASGPVRPFLATGASLEWFGELRTPGPLLVSVPVRLPPGDTLTFRLEVSPTLNTVSLREVPWRGRPHVAHVTGDTGEVTLLFGTYDIQRTGYYRLALLPASGAPASKVEVVALDLGGAATTNAHFNLKERRNAASVHLRYPTDSTWPVTGFYSEVTAVDDPVTTYYMATGFARGYFGMQVNSPTERRIIFSVWDAAEGRTADDRSTVARENQVQLLAKGEGVEASVFGNEGTGGHSHLVYSWKTGSVQRFFVTAEPNGASTDYSGWWFHPDRQEWMLIASFRAPKDGGYLRRLYAFSENFGGATGHLRRKALYGRQWIRLADGEWRELTAATFTHDVTGREDRLDRFMGVQDGQFFLSHGGFMPGFTASGSTFTRPASGPPPVVNLPPR